LCQNISDCREVISFDLLSGLAARASWVEAAAAASAVANRLAIPVLLVCQAFFRLLFLLRFFRNPPRLASSKNTFMGNPLGITRCS
jgi:hypothetical protein